MGASTSRKHRLQAIAVLVAAAVGLYLGWRGFWFLTDDAHIVFRYVSNSLLGHGYSWNPPPFRPVEGYTCFAWVVILDLTWRLFGVQPPDAANSLLLLFSFGTLLLAAFAVRNLRLAPGLRGARVALLCVVLLGCLTNRTFLAWSSSGLETALFNFCLTLWIVITVFGRAHRDRWLFATTLSAALVYLCRPDGLLVVAATLVLIVASLVSRVAGRVAGRRPGLSWFASIAPLGLVAAHLAWRRSFYGEWLPNTYYAKQVAAWPEAGVRYFASFVLEYALWIWLTFLITATVVCVVRSVRVGRGITPESTTSTPPRAPGPRLRLIVVVFTVGIHLGYYTLVVGGDHFEYRVYSYLVPLIFLSFCWALNQLRLRTGIALVVCAMFLAASWPIPWTHWLRTRDLGTREQTFMLQAPVADAFPGPLRCYAQAFDDLQSWLIKRAVCIRHQEHKVFYELQARVYPRREVAEGVDLGPFPIHVFPNVGVPAWVLPQVAVIDPLGLNDWVVARTPLPMGQERAMAHDRVAPPGYIESFQPNVGLRAPGELVARKRRRELTADRIRAIEEHWRRWISEQGSGAPR